MYPNFLGSFMGNSPPRRGPRFGPPAGNWQDFIGGGLVGGQPQPPPWMGGGLSGMGGGGFTPLPQPGGPVDQGMGPISDPYSGGDQSFQPPPMPPQFMHPQGGQGGGGFNPYPDAPPNPQVIQAIMNQRATARGDGGGLLRRFPSPPPGIAPALANLRRSSRPGRGHGVPHITRKSPKPTINMAAKLRNRPKRMGPGRRVRGGARRPF